MKFLFSAALLLLIPQSVFAQVLGQQTLAQSSYVIDNSGKLYSWGSNHDGELGIGGYTDQNIPIQVAPPASINKWVLIAGGSRHTLAVGDSDKLFGWGYNNDGEIGNGSTTSQPTPARVTNPPGVTYWRAISAGADHSMGLGSNGMIYTWGANTHGQLGTGDKLPRVTPQLVSLPAGVSGWSAIAAGPSYSIAVATNGDLYFWGLTPTSNDSLRPFKVGASLRTASPLASLAASATENSAIAADGHRIISGGTSALAKVLSVAEGGSHNVALTSSTNILVRGSNSYGQLGLGAVGDQSSPQVLGMPAGVTQWTMIAAGLHHTLAMGNDGYLYAWGSNLYGELGDGSGANQNRPVRVQKFGDSVNATANLAGETVYAGSPFSIGVTLRNTSAPSGIINPTGFLVLDSPLRYTFDAPLEQLAPLFVVQNDQATASWQVDANALASGLPDSIEYSCFIRAIGTAPIIITNKIWIAPQKRPIRLLVLDTLTGRGPLQNAFVSFHTVGSAQPTDTAYTSADGTCMIRATDTAIVIIVSRENYSTWGQQITLQQADTSSSITIYLYRAPIIGTFGTVSPMMQLGIRKLAAPARNTVYALTAQTVLVTRKDSTSWLKIYTSTDSLHDIVFRNTAEGWVVGQHASILHTTDSGANWSKELTPTPQHSLNAISIVNSLHWAVGDSGLILEQHGNGPWHTIAPGLTNENLYAVALFDSVHGVVTGANGTVLYYDGNWRTLQTNKGYAIRAASFPVPSRFTVAGDSGQIEMWIGAALIPARKYPGFTSQTIRGLFFLNSFDGWAVGDSGANFVTYDGGYHWTPLIDFSSSATAVAFFSTYGRIAAEEYMRSPIYTSDQHANPIEGVVRGRQFDRDDISGVGGEMVVLNGPAGASYVAYTNYLGNYVFTGVPPGQYSVEFDVRQLDGSFKTKTYDQSILSAGSVLTQDDHFTKAAVSQAIVPASMAVYPNPASSYIMIPASAAGDQIEIFNAIGVRVMQISNKDALALSIRVDIQTLPNGAYFYRTIGSSIVNPFEISR